MFPQNEFNTLLICYGWIIIRISIEHPFTIINKIKSNRWLSPFRESSESRRALSGDSFQAQLSAVRDIVQSSVKLSSVRDINQSKVSAVRDRAQSLKQLWVKTLSKCLVFFQFLSVKIIFFLHKQTLTKILHTFAEKKKSIIVPLSAQSAKTAIIFANSFIM